MKLYKLLSHKIVLEAVLVRRVNAMAISSFQHWRLQALAVFFLYGSYADHSSVRSRLQNRESSSNDIVTPLVLREQNESWCDFPELNPFSREVTRLSIAPKRIDCRGTNWVRCHLSRCKVVPSILKRHSLVTCKYRDILYQSDDKYTLGPKRLVNGSASYTLVKSDHVRVKCTERHRKSWNGMAIGFRKVQPKTPKPQNKINIQIVLFDSTSKNGFIRRMPLSYKTLTKDLNAVVLNRHNILGDGTAAAMFPMLTGEPLTTFAHLRKSPMNHRRLDEIPFIFFLLRDKGYRTSFFEDFHKIAVFNQMYNGFQKQPADHYLRPFFLEEYRKKMILKSKLIAGRHCIGDEPQFAMMLRITWQFMELSSPRFGVMINSLAHDDFNMITNADSTLSQFLLDFKKSKHANDTVLIVMGDHGQRFGKLRQTAQGHVEERLPLVAFVLPTELKLQRPDTLETLQENANILTTHFDMHSTFLDIFGLKNYRNSFTVPGSYMSRSISLFENVSESFPSSNNTNEIPKNRSCRDADVGLHYCTCRIWKDVSKNDKMYQTVGKEMVKFLNLLTDEKRAKCASRNLVRINWVKSAKANWNVESLLNKSTATMKAYKAQIVTDPGSAVFEAYIKYEAGRNTFAIQETDISRVNEYGNESICVSATHPHLRKYCYCKNK